MTARGHAGWGESLNDAQVMHAMALDDMYHVQSVLARGAGELTELVTIEGAGPFVRKKIPAEMARRGVWSALGQCSCTRLPRVEATYELPDQFVVVYDYVPGKTAESLVKESGVLPEAEATRIASEVCEAAGALHELGVIHRDISPRNIVVSSDGAHLIDLGIARLRVEGAVRDTNALGTYGFAAPEQYGFEQTDARSDVYSIGCVLGYLLTGLVPNADGYQEALADEAHVSAQVRTIVQKACSFEPSSRYQSAAELSAALRGEKPAEAEVLVAEQTASAATRGKTPRGARPSRRYPWFITLAQVMVFVLAAFCMVMFVRGVLGRQAASGAANSGGKVAAEAPAASASAAQTAEAPSSGGAATAPEDNVLQVKTLGWFEDTGFAYAVYEMSNTSDDVCVSPADVTVTGYAKDSSVKVTLWDMATYLYPGQTVTRVAMVGEALGVTSVGVTCDAPESYMLRNATAADAPVLSASGVDVTQKGEEVSVTGTVALDRAGANDVPYTCVCVVFKDAAGNIVGGGLNSVDTPAEGASAPFQIDCYSVGDYASYEVYVSQA